MSRTAHLSTAITVYWQCSRGFDHDADVDVDYTFDGDKELTIKSARVIGDTVGISDWDFDELVYEKTFDRAVEEYADWAEEA